MVTGYSIANGVTTVLGWAIYMDMKHWEFPVYFQRKREMILQHYSEVKGTVASMDTVNQEASSPAPNTIIEQDYAPLTPSVRPSEQVAADILDLLNAIPLHCEEQEQAGNLLQKLYSGEFCCNMI